MPRYRWFILVSFLVLLPLLGACGPATPLPEPEVFALEVAEPSPSDVLPLQTSLDFVFNRPLDPSVTERVFCMYAADEKVPVKGEISFPGGRTLRFTPAEPLRPNTTYIVLLGTGITATDGTHLPADIHLTYTTEAALGILSVSPEDGSKSIQPDTAITVVFNKPMVPLTSREDASAAPLPLEIVPHVTGTGRWVSTAIYLFQPDAPLKGNTTYTVTVPESVAALNGETLREDFTWSFTTRAARVVSVYLDDLYLNLDADQTVDFVRLDAAIEIRFNTAMDPRSTQAALRVKASNGDDGAVPPLRLTWKDDNSTLIIAPEKGTHYAPGTTYAMTLAAYARSADGSSLERDVEIKFRTVGQPAVLWTRPAPGTTQNAYAPWVSVSFNTYLDKESIEGHIRISPAPPKLYWNLYDRHLSIGALQADTTYTITLLPGIADIYGNKLAAPYTFTITTAPLQPYGDVMLPSETTLINAHRDTPIWIQYDNLDTFTLTLYAVDDDKVLQTMANYRSCSPGGEEPLAVWSPANMQRNDASRSHYLSVSLTELNHGAPLAPGPYCLTVDFSPNPDRRPLNTYWLMVVTDNITLETTTSNTLAWVTDLETGEPQADLPVVIYPYDTDDSLAEPFAPQRTNTDGVAFWEDADRPARFALVHTDDRFAITNASWSASYALFNSARALIHPSWFNAPLVAYVYTDRPLYRPGQEIFFKGVLRTNDDLHYGLLPVSEVWVSLRHDGKLVAQQKVPVSALGTFSGSVMLAPEAPVGTYTWEVRVSPNEKDIGMGTARVATYHKPVFLVNLVPEQEILHPGEETRVRLEATYYAGDSVGHGEVTWEVTADESVFQPPAKYDRYTFHRETFGYWEDETFDADLALPAGFQHDTIDAQGRLEIPLAAPVEVGDNDIRLTVWTDVTDAVGNTASGHASVLVRVSDVYVGIKADNRFVSAGEPIDFSLVALDPQGAPLADQPITVTVAEKQWHSVQRRDASGVLRWESYLETIPVGTFTDIRTDAEGQAVFPFTPEKGGIYTISAKTADAAGRPRVASVSLWVAGSDAVFWDRDNEELPLLADKENYQPGDTAHLFVPQPFGSSSYALLTLARARIYDYRVFRLDTPATTLDIPLDGSMAPIISASVMTVRGASDEQPPGYAVGRTSMHIALDEQTVQVTLSPDRERLTPGETVHIAIETRDANGQPVPAEVSLALVDKAIYALAADYTDLLRFFYPDNPALFQMACATGLDYDLQAHNLYLNRWLPEGEGMGSGGGDDKGANARGVITLRENFRDTAYWRADIRTDAQGRAEVAVTLPDNMTTWVLTAHAVTADSRFGKTTAEIVVNRPFFVRLHTPAFFTGGDLAVVQAVVHNATDQALEATVSLPTHAGLTLESPNEQHIQVPARGQAVARWEVRVPLTATRVDLLAEARAGAYHDVSRPLLTTLPDGGIPVYQFTTREQVGTAGLLTDAGSITEHVLPPANALHSTLKLDLSGSLVSNLASSLEGVPPPEGNFPVSWASNLEINVAVWRAYHALGLTPPKSAELAAHIRRGIQALEATQVYSGGWGWSRGAKPTLYVTAQAAEALLLARDAGFPVDKHTLQGAARFIARNLQEEGIPDSRWEQANRAFEIAVAARLGLKGDAASAAYALGERMDRDSAANTRAWAYLLMAAREMGAGDELRQMAARHLRNAMVRSAAGVHWDGEGWRNDDLIATALALDALLDADERPEDLGLAVHWLMTRRKSGHWHSRYYDAVVIGALAHWAERYDARPDYDYRIVLGEETVEDGHMDADRAQTPTIYSWTDTLPADLLTPLVIQRTAGPGVLYYDAYLEVTLPAQDVTARSDGVTVIRRYYHLDDLQTPDTAFRTGETVQVRLEIVAPHDLHEVILTDYLPAGMEAMEFAPARDVHSPDDFLRWGWGAWYFDHREIYDERVVFGAEDLPAGVYTIVYYARAAVPGVFQTRPAEAHEALFPDISGRSAGEEIMIK